MLQTIRDRAQGWITGVIIGLLVVAFALWGIQSYLGGSAGAEVVAKVNGVSITHEQLNLVYSRMRQSWQARMDSRFPLDQTLQAQLKEHALQQLIGLQVLSQAAKHQGYRINPLQLDAVIIQTPAFQENGQFSPERFQALLNSLSYSQQAFVNDLEKTLLVNQPQAGILGTSFALPNEVEQAIRLANQKRDINYTVIPAARFLDTIRVSPQALQDYYQRHLAEFQSPAKVRIEYVELSAPRLQQQLQVSNQELQQYYNDNVQAYSEPQRWQVARLIIKVAGARPTAGEAAQKQIKKLYHRAQQGESWTRLTQRTAHASPNTVHDVAEQWLTAQQMPDELRRAVMPLKPGQVAPPFKTLEGYNLVKLLAVKKSQVQSFTAVRHQVQQTVLQQKLQQRFSDQSEQLSQLTYTNPTTLEPAAKALGLTLQTTDYFTAQGGSVPITHHAKVIAAAFSDEVLKQGNNSDLIPLDDKTMVVLRVKDYQPAAALPLATVKNAIEKVLQQQAAEKQAKQLGNQLLAQLQQGANPQQLIKRQHLDWTVATGTTRQSANINGQILRVGFSLPRAATKAKPVYAGITLANGDYGLVGLSSVYDGAVAKAEPQEQKIFQGQIANSTGQLDYELYVNGLMKQAKIVINKS